MTSFEVALSIGTGSAVGGMARYALVVALEAGRDNPRCPLGTLVVNLLGSLLLGVVASTAALAEAEPLRLALVAALGSFTTVSAFVLESWQRRTHRAVWIGYGLVTVTGCLLLFQAGRWIA